jgi:subtilisin
MAKKDPKGRRSSNEARVSSSVDELLVAALERGDESLETGRYIVTYKDTATEEGLKALNAEGLRIADARDFDEQAITLESVGDADAVTFPEIGVALISGAAFEERAMSVNAAIASDSPIEAIEPEYFAFALADPVRTRGAADSAYLRGFVRAAEAIAHDLRQIDDSEAAGEEEALVMGATWGLVQCKVPPSLRSGAGMRVAVLDTGMDLGHPDFAGRGMVTQTFVGQPVQDLHSHGTHCIGTACGPKAPPGTTPRYGVAHRAPIFVGKVLSNSGSGTTAGILAGMNWAIANRCVVISMSLGAQTPVQAGYTAAGAAALQRGCLVVAAAGNNQGQPTGAPANSPTIMAVASLDPSLSPSAFSNMGKIEIAAPGRDVFSSVPRPNRYGTKSGTSMATPHVAGCAALWAETNPALRGMDLWRRLQATARRLPFPPARVGAGLVQAP